MFSKKNIIQKSAIILGMLLYAVILYVFQIGCPILRFTGIPCPGCGMTRAWIAVLHLDFAAAFSYNFMFWAVPLLCIILWCDGKLFKNQKWNNLLCICIAIGFAIKWLQGFIDKI